MSHGVDDGMATFDVPADRSVFVQQESNVRHYSRLCPVVFERAKGSLLYDEQGREYLDFLCGAGSLNYGHNNPWLRDSLIEYLSHGGLVHSLDLHTTAKRTFLETFRYLILSPRNLDYVVQFTGPTGTNAVEAALKLARKVTGRRVIIAFTNGFHGMTLGALAATGNRHPRAAAGGSLPDVVHVPFDGYFGDEVDTVAYAERLLSDPSSGIDLPAAVILETVQGEGGLNAASLDWLQRLERLCRELGVLIILDDVQTGCGRTGTFFSFEPAGIEPDMVVLSKSLSGFGLPFAINLIARRHDIWKPGEHNGTFRGNNLAFVTATEALKRYWSTSDLMQDVQRKSTLLGEGLSKIARAYPDAKLGIKGRGLMQGLNCRSGRLAAAISTLAFYRGLLIETCGPYDEVVKCMPPLTTSDEQLDRALNILTDSVGSALLGDVG
jgi:diaminobutyrate-2-oxoglutarate transaminase